jgi:hypothetical protein
MESLRSIVTGWVCFPNAVVWLVFQHALEDTTPFTASRSAQCQQRLPNHEQKKPRLSAATYKGPVEAGDTCEKKAPPWRGIDLVTLTFAVVLAAALAFLLSRLVPQLVDLMMMPPPLSGAR